MDAHYGVIDYGMGNLKSIFNAVKALGKQPVLVKNPDTLCDVDAIILPGVGAFADGMNNLNRSGMVHAMEKEVFDAQKPFLGICLGMQFLADMSYEFGQYLGLGWINGSVEMIQVKDQSFKIPHMGWNNIDIKYPGILFQGIDPDPVFYFVHSFYLNPVDENHVTSTCYHGMEVTASVEKGHIFGTQFHPEKSLGSGLQVLNNFCSFVEGGHA